MRRRWGRKGKLNRWVQSLVLNDTNTIRHHRTMQRNLKPWNSHQEKSQCPALLGMAEQESGYPLIDRIMEIAAAIKDVIFQRGVNSFVKFPVYVWFRNIRAGKSQETPWCWTCGFQFRGQQSRNGDTACVSFPATARCASLTTKRENNGLRLTNRLTAMP